MNIEMRLAIVVLGSSIGLIGTTSVSPASTQKSDGAVGDKSRTVSYQLLWTGNKDVCQRARRYATKERHNYVNIGFGNVPWTQLDDPSRKTVDVMLAGSTRTVLLSIVPRRAGLDWDYGLVVYATKLSHSDLLNRGPIDPRVEMIWEPDRFPVPELARSRVASRLVSWCKKEGWKDCEKETLSWRFSFFDLVKLDGQVYLTAASEKYNTPMDRNMPQVVMIAEYVGNLAAGSQSNDIAGKVRPVCYLLGPQ